MLSSNMIVVWIIKPNIRLEKSIDNPDMENPASKINLFFYSTKFFQNPAIVEYQYKMSLHPLEQGVLNNTNHSPPTYQTLP